MPSLSDECICIWKIYAFGKVTHYYMIYQYGTHIFHQILSKLMFNSYSNLLCQEDKPIVTDNTTKITMKMAI